MKITIILIFGTAFLVALCTARPADQDYEYEDEPAPPPKPVARSPLIGRRNPLAGRGASAKTTSTTAAPPPKEEEVPEEGEEIEEEVAPEPSSTTESPKKIKTGIRPFRSNDDLLAALKRRREQAVHNKSHPKPVAAEEESHHEPASAPAPKASRTQSTTGRRRFNKNESPAAQDVQEPSSTSAPAIRAGRRFSSRN